VDKLIRLTTDDVRRLVLTQFESHPEKKQQIPDYGERLERCIQAMEKGMIEAFWGFDPALDIDRVHVRVRVAQ
jgi:hypothetical protein